MIEKKQQKDNFDEEEVIDLSKLIKIENKIEESSKLKKDSKKKNKNVYLAHKISSSIYYAIIFLVIINLLLVFFHLQSTNSLNDKIIDLKGKNVLLTEENDLLKNNLNSLEEDLKAFDEFHNIGYSEFLGKKNISKEPFELVKEENKEENIIKNINNSIWQHYNSVGLIMDDCLIDAKLVKGSKETKIVISSSNFEAQSIKLLIDGTHLETFSLKEGILGIAIVNLEQGTHYLDLVYSGKEDFELDLIRVGDRTIDSGFLFDKGLAFSAFDCEDTKKTSSFDEPGAIRFKIEKV